MKDETGNTYFKEYWDNPPKSLTLIKRIVTTQEGQRRRNEYIKKHPPEKCPDISPSGWDEPMQPKGRKRRK